MEVGNAEEFRDVLQATLERHARKPVDLLIVSDIEQWSRARSSISNGNPVAMSVVDCVTGGWGVLLRQQIDQISVRSVLDRICFSGRFDVYQRLKDPEAFLRHLVLHELAHLNNNWDQSREDDCDDWAFERLEQNAL